MNTKDPNRSRDVKGPELIRPEEIVKNNSIQGSGIEPTKVLEKHNLSDLHHGDIESPLTALGQQDVVVPHPMGSDSPDHLPSVKKGGGGAGPHNPKGMGRSIAKKMEYAEKKRAKY